jgi:membrane-bound lytic murein transglycosylase D
MPNETRNYLPKLQAVKNIVARPEAFSLVLPTLKNHPYFLSVPIKRDIDIDLAARLADVPLDEFRQLNPQMNKPVILAAGTPQVLLPFDNAQAFVQKLEQHRGRLASWTAWVAPKTLKPAEAAKRAGMSEAQLRDVNHIPPRMLVKAGSTLLVPRNGHVQADVSEHLAENGMMALAPDAPALKRMTFKARKGDSVASIAKRYRVSNTQLLEWNKLAAGASLKPGQTVVVFVATAKKTAVHTAHRAAKPAVPARARVASR